MELRPILKAIIDGMEKLGERALSMPAFEIPATKGPLGSFGLATPSGGRIVTAKSKFTSPQTLSSAEQSLPKYSFDFSSLPFVKPIENPSPFRVDWSEKLNGARREFRRLSEELAEPIRKNEFSGIIADDVSGRIPALFIQNQMRRAAAEQRTHTVPTTYFMAGGRGGLGMLDQLEYFHETIPNMVQRLNLIPQANRSGRFLFVTDGIDSGGSLSRAAQAMERAQIKYDVASLGSRRHTDLLEMRDWPTATRFFTGNKGGQVELYSGGPQSYPLLSSLRVAIGVEKYGSEAISRVNRDNIPSLVSLRQELKGLSNEIFDEVHGIR